jgi:hypothetical protein
VARVIEAHATAGARLLRPSRQAARRPRSWGTSSAASSPPWAPA